MSGGEISMPDPSQLPLTSGVEPPSGVGANVAEPAVDALPGQAKEVTSFAVSDGSVVVEPSVHTETSRAKDFATRTAKVANEMLGRLGRARTSEELTSDRNRAISAALVLKQLIDLKDGEEWPSAAQINPFSLPDGRKIVAYGRRNGNNILCTVEDNNGESSVEPIDRTILIGTQYDGRKQSIHAVLISPNERYVLDAHVAFAKGESVQGLATPEGRQVMAEVVDAVDTSNFVERKSRDVDGKIAEAKKKLKGELTDDERKKEEAALRTLSTARGYLRLALAPSARGGSRVIDQYNGLLFAGVQEENSLMIALKPKVDKAISQNEEGMANRVPHASAAVRTMVARRQIVELMASGAIENTPGLDNELGIQTLGHTPQDGDWRALANEVFPEGSDERKAIEAMFKQKGKFDIIWSILSILFVVGEQGVGPLLKFGGQ